MVRTAGLRVTSAVFLSTYLNKVDKKAWCRCHLSFVLCWPNSLRQVPRPVWWFFAPLQFSALEACSPEHMEKLAADLEQMDISAEERDLYEMTIFGDSVQLPIDGDGRILLPQDLMDYAGITEQASFVGRSKTFQISEPGAYRLASKKPAPRAALPASR